jgi:putative solute:sodium symporter small subunit
MKENKWKEYWAKNLRLIAILLVIWFLISYGAAFIAPALNNITIPLLNFPLGFWFGSQGSLIGFVLLIYVYAKRMNALDDEYGISDTTKKLTKTEEKTKVRAN